MRTTFCLPSAVIACALMIASCAGSRPALPAAPPRLELERSALKPCALPRLPEAATLADLEASYLRRGAAIVACDAARRLAVETLEAERALRERWLAGVQDP